MPEFNTPIDIANRALQRIGAKLIGSSGFNEDSKEASQTGFCYGKLRQAELQRNVWTFATERTAIRPVNLKTAILRPTLWNSTVTYFLGSVVSDAVGTLWESTQRNNLNNQPGINLQAWKPYFGPMTAEPFQSSAFFAATTQSGISSSFLTITNATNYYIGELVYTIKGDGTFNVYKSLVDGNGVHPAIPNQWSVDTIYKTDDVVNVYPNWSSLTTYSEGQTVTYTDGNAYSSLINSNLNNIPPNSSTDWALQPTLNLQDQFNPQATSTNPQLIPGTTPIAEWNIFATYGLGSFVMWNAAVYVSLVTNNTGNFPSSAADWTLCTGGTLYQSPIDFNLGNTPSSAPALWSSVTTYSSGNTVAASDGSIYESLSNSNLNNNPVTDGGIHWQNTGVLNPWTTVFTLGGGNPLWIQIGGSAFPNGVGIAAFQLTYPVGSGPVSQTWTKNAYHLPSGYLRRAPQDPSAGRNSWLGAPGNLNERDWVIEDKFLVTTDSAAIVFRFVADKQNVQDFKPLFCEMLSCSMALEICEPLTQSTAKKQVAAQEYKMRRTEAIIQDGIETGSEEAPLDDFIATRI